MDAHTLMQLVLIVSQLCLSVLLLAGSFHRQRSLLPPGPKGLPIIGNMLMMKEYFTHKGLAKLANQYGGILHLRMGFLNVVAISSPDMARQVLQVQDNIFSNRPATIAIRYLTYDRADMSFAQYGPFWRQMRKLCIMKLLGRKRAEFVKSAAREEIDIALRTTIAAAAKTRSAVNMREVLFSLTKNVIYRAAFGTRSQEGQDEFTGIVQEVAKLFVAFNVADLIPWLGWLDPQGIKPRLVKARNSLDRFIDRIIDDHMQKKNNLNVVDDECETDMVDDMLAWTMNSEEAKLNKSEDDQQDRPRNAVELSRNNIKAMIMDVMFGGTEPISLVIEWAMAELMRNPEDLKRVQSELNDVVGLDRRLQPSDMNKLTYLKCVLKETLRLHPPIPLLLHETTEDTEVSGYHIPKKSHVMINVWAIGRDKASWVDNEPETFKPSRFLKDTSPDIGGGYYEFIPFGSGRRSCPGMQLGVYMLELVMAELLHCFTWELPDGTTASELDMNDVSALTVPRASVLLLVPTTKRVVCSL